MIAGAHCLAAVGVDTTEGRSFVRDRLALEGKVIFLLGGGFWIAVTALDSLLGIQSVWQRLQWRPSIFHVLGVVLMGVLWWAARAREWSIRTVGLLDAVALVISCWCWAMMLGGSGQTLTGALLANLVTVTVRAVVVPSAARRTFWLSTIAVAPAVPVAVTLGLPTDFAVTQLPLHAVVILVGVTTALWSAVAVVVATVISGVIYGLRQRVKAANELGMYTLEEKIGAGGMGEVWRAHHRLLIRPAAIKIIRARALGSRPGDPSVLLRRFEREARATAALQSPHTVQLYDFGVADDGRLYYVMELLRGLNTEAMVQKFGPLPPERAIHILIQVCDSLADAHRNGLIHRDIKPANVFVSRYGTAYDFVKVLDFGLVKLDRPRDSESDPRLTAAGTTTGTPAFMAPEMVLLQPTDHRVDVYAFGCLAYWLLTGQLVFEAGSSMRMMLDHAHSPPPRPSRYVDTHIPADLDQLILDCLEKDPALRPASAMELAARLQACAVSARWTADRAERWWTKNVPALAEARPVADVLLDHEEGHPAVTLRR